MAEETLSPPHPDPDPVNTFYQIESNSKFVSFILSYFYFLFLLLFIYVFYSLIRLQNSSPSLTEPDGWRKTLSPPYLDPDYGYKRLDIAAIGLIMKAP